MDHREEYKSYVTRVNPIYLPSANVISGRGLRMKRFRSGMKQAWTETKFG